ncbi:chorismate-binding protein [Janibacter sp. GXQ6167]|uniref:chorismate-binding protein n=1 Tax=Janibacter sp. GXQ6167 TaxID=3240791 RepID=UPI0035269209
MDFARFADRTLTGVEAITHDLAEVTSGQWAVVVTFEGRCTAVKFTNSLAADHYLEGGPLARWEPPAGSWRTSLDERAYTAGVSTIREHIAAGTVYQVNLCRTMTAALPPSSHLPALAPILARGNPAPYAATIHVPSAGLDIVSASPEAYLLRDGARVVSRPIKGTGRVASDLGSKDHAENVMITDLVRNDLSHVALPGTVAVEALCAIESHPGLVHLVSDVACRLRPGVGWSDILEGTFPPGSVSGAPKSSALRIIGELEPGPRGPYCGAIGWIDADRDQAALAVGIRTFWAEGEGGARTLSFGTGAGITWGSDPHAEWAETELKAARLVALASSGDPAGAHTVRPGI